MGQTILTDQQRIVLELFANEVSLRNVFYLSGGTALSEFYLQHRDSEDLDFFTDEAVDTILVQKFIQKITKHFGIQSARIEHIHDRRLFFLNINENELKIEFTSYPFLQLEKHIKQKGIFVDSLRDITANKLAALIDRFEPKDFVDLYFILQNRSLQDVKSDTEKKFGLSISPLFLGGELAKVRRIEILPRMRVPLSLDELKTFFTKLARELKPEILNF
ncbi:nucleotidyl transferase AbiEii/AbiGii toxin family protein [Candidatus Uhrbacteria bacterium]|nr:nucleotidyl transferase AbiEii/AbiGii toxin family protein [Candidatus Uhrbacteria bacterium]